MTATSQSQSGRRAVWAAGLLVAAGAGVATAHGLYQVAAAARVPTAIAWLYPLITDGLALVAYAATARLHAGGRRYAAGIVVLAAGLSGLAQAIYLAGGLDQHSTAPTGLRFGVGAWPAIAAALTAHLLHLISGTAGAAAQSDALAPSGQPSSPAPMFNRPGVQPSNPGAVQPSIAPSVQPFNLGGVQPFIAPSVQPFNLGGVQPFNQDAGPGAVQPARTAAELNAPVARPERSTPAATPRAVEANPARSGSAGGGGPATERARQAARSHYGRHGRLPTATELMELADVARGTAGTVLKVLRAERPALHVVNADTETRTDK